MRIAFFGQSGPFAPVALRDLVPLLPPQAQIVLVVVGRRPEKRHAEHEYTPAGAGTAFPSLSRLAPLSRVYGFPVLSTANVNDPQAIEQVAAHEPDWIVCVGYDRLFTPALLNVPKCGSMNVHPSHLPRWRGPAPIFWALRNREETLGVSVHAIDPGEDRGPIFRHGSLAIVGGTTGDKLFEQAGRLGAQLVARCLEEALTGALVATPQDHSQKTRAPRPTPRDACVDPRQFTCEQLRTYLLGSEYFVQPSIITPQKLLYPQTSTLQQHPGQLQQSPAEYQDGRWYVACADGCCSFAERS